MFFGKYNYFPKITRLYPQILISFRGYNHVILKTDQHFLNFDRLFGNDKLK